MEENHFSTPLFWLLLACPPLLFCSGIVCFTISPDLIKCQWKSATHSKFHLDPHYNLQHLAASKSGQALHLLTKVHPLNIHRSASLGFQLASCNQTFQAFLHLHVSLHPTPLILGGCCDLKRTTRTTWCHSTGLSTAWHMSMAVHVISMLS